MTESFGFCQIVRSAADSGKLQSLGALIVEKSNLLIADSSRPAPGHNVRHCADVGIVNLEMRRARNFFLFFRSPCDKAEHAIAPGHNFGRPAIGKLRGGA